MASDETEGSNIHGGVAMPPSEEVPLLGKADDSLPPRNMLCTVVLYFMAIHFLVAFCEMILVAPLIKLFEQSLCLRYYNFPSGGVAESQCKILEIQHELATIRGWKSLFDTLPVLLMAIPMGKIGDRYGRRRIMAFSLIGVALSLCEVFVVCAFPKVFRLQYVWLSSILLLCGGGLNAASAYMWAFAAEKIPADRRSHAFYHIFSAFYVAELLGSFIASVTIDISPWVSVEIRCIIPCGLALGSLVLCLVLLLCMPDLRTSKVAFSEPIDEEELDGSWPLSRSPIVDGILSALSNTNVLLILPVFLVGIFRYTTLNILIQYASVQFGMKISTGATFYTETAIVNIILFLFLIPRTTSYIRLRYKTRPEVLDLFLVRFSVCIMAIGCFCIGFAPSSQILPIGVFVFSMGFGSRVAALSLISYWIADGAKATLYSAIVVLESLGHAFGDPAMQQIFAASLGFPYFWHALPFFVAGVGAAKVPSLEQSELTYQQALYGLASISTSFLQVKAKTTNEHAESLVA